MLDLLLHTLPSAASSTRMGKPDIEQFLSYLARERAVSASIQNQAKAALLFLYRKVLEVELPWLDDIEQAKRPQKLPVVLTRAETWQVLEHLTDTHALIGKLLYGSGLRLMEACRLWVKDLSWFCTKQNTPACIADGGVGLPSGQ